MNRIPGSKIKGANYEGIIRDLLGYGIAPSRISTIMKRKYDITLDPHTVINYKVNYFDKEAGGLPELPPQEKQLLNRGEYKISRLNFSKDPKEMELIVSDIYERIDSCRTRAEVDSKYEYLINQYYKLIKDIREYQQKYDLEKVKAEVTERLVSDISSIAITILVPFIPEANRKEAYDAFKERITELLTTRK